VTKVKILFLGANPENTVKLALDREIRDITYKIRLSEDRDLLVIESVWAVRPDDLLQYLNQYQPQIVHFSGHGSTADEIILQDNRGNAKSVNQEAIKALFTTLKYIQLVVLNACFSTIQSQEINKVIDYVIGMNAAIGDEAAIVFAAAFYSAIGFNRTVQEAFDKAKTALLLEGIPGENTPDLLIRDGVSPCKSITHLNISSDFEVFKSFRKVFDRPAFTTSCINELFIKELREAIDDIQAAINTGKLYSRSGRLLAEIPDKGQFQSISFQQVFDKVPGYLTELKILTVHFEKLFKTIYPSYSNLSNFYSMVRSVARMANRQYILIFVQRMDEIDQARNKILDLLNSLLIGSNKRLYPLIELSSKVIKEGRCGGLDEIVALLNQGMNST
jgi:hypothetical protein